MRKVFLFGILILLFPLMSYSASALTTDANFVRGLSVYYHTSPDETLMQFWNGTSVTTNKTIPFIRGQSKWVRVESSPTRDQSIIMSNYNNGTGQVIAVVWNATNFTHAKNISVALTGGETDKRGFDVSYMANGNAMIVGANGTAGINFVLWNGTNFTTTGTSTFANCTATPNFVDLKGGLNNTAFVIVADTNGDVCAKAWNGTSWAAERTLETTAAAGSSSRKTIDVNTESIAGDAVLTYETATLGRIGSCNFNMNNVPFSNGWCNDVTLFDLPNLGDTIFIDSAQHRTDNRVLFGYYQNTLGDINVIEWNGDDQTFSNSNVPTLIDGSAETGGDAVVAVSYSGDRGFVAFDDSNLDQPSYTYCNSSSLCGDGIWNVPTATTGIVNCGVAEDLDAITLSQNPFDNRLMLMTSTQSTHTKCQQRWNGETWDSGFKNLESGSARTDAIEFSFAFDQFIQFGNITRAWISNTSTPASPATYSTFVPRIMSVVWNVTGFDIMNVSMIHDFFGINASLQLNFSAGNEYKASFAPVAVGNYTWREIAQTTFGQINTTDLYRYEVIKAVPSITITPTPSNNITQGDVSSVLCVSDNAQASIVLTKNGTIVPNPHVTILPCGTWLYGCSQQASQNYTSQNTSIFVYTNSCNETIPPVIVIPPNATTTPINGLLQTGKCPNETTSRIIVFIGLLMLMIGVFVINELFFRMPLLSALVGIGIIFYGYTMIGCNGAIGTTYIAFGVMMVLYGVTSGFK